MAVLSIIVPVYNEAPTIERVIGRIEDVALPEGFKREIIIINDGSTDGTKDLLQQFESRHRVLHTPNAGKGGAVRKGFSLATGDYIVVQDADLEQDPNDFRALLKPILDNKADVVLGSRFFGSYKPLSLVMNLHYLINKAFTGVTNLLTGYRSTDVWTGYKMYSRKALDAIAQHLRSNGIEFELEVMVLLSQHGMRVADVAISYDPRWYDQGKKTNWRQAVRSMIKLIGFRLRRVS